MCRWEQMKRSGNRLAWRAEDKKKTETVKCI